MLARATDRQRSAYRKPASRLIAVVVVALVGAALLLAYVLSEVYQQAERQAETDAGNVVGVLEVRLNAIFPADPCRA